MRPDQIALVINSFELLPSVFDRVADKFYDHLFDLEPALYPRLKNDRAELRRQFTLALQVFKKLAQPEEFKTGVQQLSYTLARLGIEKWHYTVFRVALLWALEEGLGRNFNYETKLAWSEACYHLINALRQMAGRAETVALGTPNLPIPEVKRGGWLFF